MISGGSPSPRQQPFGLGKALSGGLWFPLAFRRAGIRFSDSPVPAGYSAVPCGRPTAVASSPHRGFRVSHDGDTVGVDAYTVPGRGVRSRAKLSLFRYTPNNAVSATISAPLYITTRHRFMFFIRPTFALPDFFPWLKVVLGFHPRFAPPNYSGRTGDVAIELDTVLGHCDYSFHATCTSHRLFEGEPVGAGVVFTGEK